MRARELSFSDIPKVEILDENLMAEKLKPFIRKNGFIVRIQAEKILGMKCRRILPSMVRSGILKSEKKSVRFNKTAASTLVYTLK